MNHHTSLRVFLWLVVVALMAQSASAYNWHKCNGNKRVWDSNNVTLQPSSVSFPPASNWRASIEAARTAWNTAPGTHFDFTYNYSNSVSYSSGDNVNSILRTNNYNWDPDNNPFTTILAVTLVRHKWCVWPVWGGKIKEADVLFNESVSWDTSVNPTVPLAPFVANSTLVGVHEMGHAFGLDHENGRVATMNASYPAGGPIAGDNDAVPHGDDVLGNRAGYGTIGTPRDLYASVFQIVSPGESDEIGAPPVLYRSTPTVFRYTMGNRGAVHETSVGVKFYLSADRNITAADHLVGSAGFSMNQGTSPTRAVSFTVPASVPAGSYHFGWIVDPENYIAETDEGNNSGALVGQTQVVDQIPPKACFTATPTSGSSPLIVTVDASCSFDPDGSITSYTWDMGDGVTRTGQSFTYPYLQDGVFVIELTVQDDHNLTDQETRTIKVFCGNHIPDPNGPEQPCGILG